MKKSTIKWIYELTGRQHEQYSVARKMLRQHFPVSSICRVTQLSSQELDQLKVEIDRQLIAEETLHEIRARQHSHQRQIHLLNTKAIDESQVQQQAPWLLEDDWYLGHRLYQQRLGQSDN
jgi:hypothetical protein